ncbi:hypothetical protein F4677DRAFT_419633 [Hypoxylon crocopeplum]|nr:hypothetical protein F4677DRAFT_419633 [Hypoxylon crocopeplum]
MTMPPPNLTSIPLEVLLQITSYLKTPDYGAMRLTCKHIEISVFRTFAQKYFTKIQFMRTEFSFQALVDISTSRLSSYLKHVVVGTDVLGTGIPDRLIGPSGDRTVNKWDRYNHLRADQLAFFNTSQDQQMLVEAFRNLDLDVVEIRAPGRAEYGLYDAVCYGTSQIFRETSINMRWEAPYINRSSREANASCLQTVLFALGKSGLKPKKFKLAMTVTSLNDSAFNIPGFMGKVVSPMLHDLETLDLAVDPNSTEGMRLIAPKGRPLRQINTYYLRKFILQSSQVTRLCLAKLPESDGFFEWLASPSPISNEEYDGPTGLEPPDSPTLPKLSELELSNCTMPWQHLVDIVSKFSTTLRRLSIHSVFLDIPDKDSSALAVAKLAEAGRYLKEVHLVDIWVRFANGHRDFMMRFQNGDQRPVSGSFSCTGPDMKKVLGGLNDVIRDNYVHPRSEDEDEDELDDSDDDDDDDDHDGFGSYFDEYGEYVEEYDDLLDEIDQDLNEELMIAALYHI